MNADQLAYNTFVNELNETYEKVRALNELFQSLFEGHEIVAGFLLSAQSCLEGAVRSTNTVIYQKNEEAKNEST